MSLSLAPVGVAAPAPREPMPPGIQNIYIYDIFNTTSWSVVLGAPMLLFMQHLNATATVVAVAFSLSPLLNILQIPAARFVERVGYRRFVVGGWTTRSFLIIGMAIVAFLPDSVDRTTRLVLMLFFSFLYNTLRGISVCGMLPWFTLIVPESRRGEFLAKDQAAVAFSGIVSLCLFGILLTGGANRYTFGIVFSISFIAAMISLYYLRRVPDVPVQKSSSSRQVPPWKDMLFYPPFFKYLRYNVIVNMALGASGAFWVRYFKMFLHVSSSNVLFLACGTNIILVLALFMITPVIDRTHNKQVLTLSGIMFICHFVGWGSIAAGLLPFNWTMVAIQAITSGAGGALWNLANVRMVMGIVPAMGRPHFLALYSVAGNVTVGTVPLIGGVIMDSLENWHASWGFFNWNAYSLLYCVLTFTMIIGLCVLRTLEEPEKMTWDVFISELLVKTPSRALSRLIGRLRGPFPG
ncbi:MAG TPA: MFS transporter [Candidatus Methylacidiphilales bacterium]